MESKKDKNRQRNNCSMARMKNKMNKTKKQAMLINDPKVGQYCDGGWGCGCGNPHRSGGCVKHPDTIVLDCVCVDCYKETKEK